MDEIKKYDKEGIISRLKKIEGQIKGIQKMIHEDKDCNDIMVQVAAARSAINKVGGIIIENYIEECMINLSKDENKTKKIDNFVDTIIKFTR